MTNPTVDFFVTLKLARDFYAIAKAERAEAEVYYAEKGYRPEYCIHGTYMWVDHDCACGYCEEGITMLHMCVQRAASYVAEFHKRLEFNKQAENMRPPGFDRKALADWAFEPIAEAFSYAS